MVQQSRFYHGTCRNEQQWYLTNFPLQVQMDHTGSKTSTRVINMLLYIPISKTEENILLPVVTELTFILVDGMVLRLDFR